MSVGADDAVAEIAEGKADDDAAAWLGDEHDILEGTAATSGFLGAGPFLEEGGEGVAVDDGAGEGVGEGELGIALRGVLVEMTAAATPGAGLADNLIEGGLLVETVAGEGVVETEGGITEPAGEFRGRTGGDDAQDIKKREGKEAFHLRSILLITKFTMNFLLM